MQRDWHESLRVGTHTGRRIHRYKWQTTGGFEAVSRLRRKVQSTDAQRCIGNAPIQGFGRGQFALREGEEEEMEERKRRGDSLARSTMSL